MRKPIELCNADLTKATFKDVMFFSLAEGGAMGCPGEILVCLKTGEQYAFNFVYGDAEIKKVEELFPPLTKCSFGIFGIDSKVPEGWSYVNLGMGNHLIVNDEVHEVFVEKMGIDAEPSEKYSRWLEVAEDIINSFRTKA